MAAKRKITTLALLEYNRLRLGFICKSPIEEINEKYVSDVCGIKECNNAPIEKNCKLQFEGFSFITVSFQYSFGFTVTTNLPSNINWAYNWWIDENYVKNDYVKTGNSVALELLPNIVKEDVIIPFSVEVYDENRICYFKKFGNLNKGVIDIDSNNCDDISSLNITARSTL